MASEIDRYERNPDYIFRRIVDEAVLVPIRQNVADMDCLFTLNDVGAFLWERLDGQKTVADLEAAVLAEYETEAADVAADVAAFLSDLEAAGAVRRV